MLADSYPKYDALSANDNHDQSLDYDAQAWTDQQQLRRHEYTAASSPLIYEQESENPDDVGSHSLVYSRKPMRSVIAFEDAQPSNSALPTSDDDIGHKTALDESSAMGSAKASQKLTIGWKTTTLLIGFYLIALLVAILHFVMMHYLNGKPTDDRKYLSQRYVTSLSLFLVASFRSSLCGSLAVAFTQHMWKVLRHKALQVSSIESLHGVRYNPFLLSKWRSFLATPLLYLTATVMWLLTVVILFPPSALTITLHHFEEGRPLLVSTFDAGYGRDFEIDQDAAFVGTSSLSSWTLGDGGSDTNGSASMLYSYPNAKLVHLSHVVLVSGAVPESTSPCGANCSYIVDFEGPVFECNKTVRNQTSTPNSTWIDAHYSGAWGSYDSHRRTSGTFTMSLKHDLGSSGELWLQELHTLQCQPAWARYQVNIEYSNGLRAFTYDITPGRKLLDTFVGAVSPNFTAKGDVGWDTDEIRDLKNINHYGLLDTVVMALAGSYDQLLLAGDGPTFPYTLSNGTILDFYPIQASFTYLSNLNLLNSIPRLFGGDNLDIQPNKTWIRDTAFNRNRYNATNAGPSFAITGEILNEIVANVTIAAMFSYYPLSIWNTTAIANVTTYRNIYSFSRPVNLILPYALSLVFSLPLLILGYLSLRSNGVAALGDSFLQLLVTVTRSEELDRIARPCSLGGDEMATKELKHTRIMFGELGAVDKRENNFGRMGFGLEEEVVRSEFRRK
ncbi:hypothetical protein BDV96DRAFT_693411 [Lophiotrema nucula]|uniref:Uncharacterized protein n=1 Tax=Lophiotrema nucula TaxID=690887 RepID=A0A6A5YME8_9PLEO|nr:hypothetical protein BDV96DRAFT_693411 [Lophiotrema nucula]